MDFEVYCDESHGDLLASQNRQVKFLVIGGLWISAVQRRNLKASIHALREKHKIGGEFKWHKVSARDLQFYSELIDLFIHKGDQVRFRCIVVDPLKVDLEKYHDGDSELGFFKFYYQLLTHWIGSGNNYKVFCDYKVKTAKRLQRLALYLNREHQYSIIQPVQAIHSSESVLIQLADVLTGLAAARLNEAFDSSSPKGKLVAYLEEKLGSKIEPTYRSETKFNVFAIEPSGGQRR